MIYLKKRDVQRSLFPQGNHISSCLFLIKQNLHMKSIITVVICFLFTFLSYSQERFLQYSSKDSIEGKPRIKGSLGVNLKLNGYYDVFGGLQESETFNIGNINVFGTDNSPSFNMDLYQTQIKFESTFITKSGKPIEGMVEFDFWGGNGHMRLRKAYVKFDHFLFGQDWVVFGDSELWPEILEWEGPPSGVWVREPLIKYFNNFNNKSWEYTLSLNAPINDYNRFGDLEPLLQDAYQSTPDFSIAFKYSKHWGHLRLASIVRNIQYKLNEKQNNFIGYGAAFSGIYRHNLNNVQFQLTGGKGVSAYNTSVQGNGFDGFPTIHGEVEAMPSYGGWASYELHYGPKWFSTFVLGYTRYYAYDSLRYILSNEVFEHEIVFNGNFDSSHYYGIVNVMYHPFERMTFGIEMDYGKKKLEYDGFTNDDYLDEVKKRDAMRISFGLMYNF